MKDEEKAVKEFLSGVSETANGYFAGSTTKNSIEYKVGDEMTFKIRAMSGETVLDIPYISYLLESDDGSRCEDYQKVSDDGWFYITASISKPGFVHLVAKACDDNKDGIDGIDPFDGGACAGISEIACGTEMPDDYFEFWEALKKESEKTEPQLIYRKKLTMEQLESLEAVENIADFDLYEMRIKVSDTDYASCVAAYPKNAEPSSLKLNMVYRGYGVAGLKKFFPMPGYITVSVNAHSIPDFEAPEYYEALQQTTLKEYGFNNNENKDPKTTYWAKMFIRDLQAARYFKDDAMFNKKDCIFSGGSQGGFQAANVAVHCGYATECYIMVPWFADLNGADKFGRMIGWRPDYEPGLAYFDTAVAIKNIKCPTMIMAGLGDYICPPSGIAAMYNQMSASGSLVYIQNKTHPYMPIEKVIYTLGDVSATKNLLCLEPKYKYYID